VIVPRRRGSLFERSSGAGDRKTGVVGPSRICVQRGNARIREWGSGRSWCLGKDDF